jgi:F0F1-type ATP synthase epsilon subunit
MTNIPLTFPIYYEVGYDNLTLPEGDIHDIIEFLCQNLRQNLYQAIEDAKLEAMEKSSEYTNLSFKPGFLDGPFLNCVILATRTETAKEIEERLVKEQKNKIKKELLLQKAKEKDLRTIQSLYKKHNITTPMAMGPGDLQPHITNGRHTENETNARNESRPG